MWKPEGPATAHRPAPKGDAFAAAQRRQRFVVTLALQAMLAVVLLGAALLVRRDAQTTAFYAWTLVVPVGFGAVFVATYLRGERLRRERALTPARDRAMAKRAYTAMAGVLVAWAAGMVGILLAL